MQVGKWGIGSGVNLKPSFRWSFVPPYKALKGSHILDLSESLMPLSEISNNLLDYQTVMRPLSNPVALHCGLRIFGIMHSCWVAFHGNYNTHSAMYISSF